MPELGERQIKDILKGYRGPCFCDCLSPKCKPVKNTDFCPHCVRTCLDKITTPQQRRKR